LPSPTFLAILFWHSPGGRLPFPPPTSFLQSLIAFSFSDSFIIPLLQEFSWRGNRKSIPSSQSSPDAFVVWFFFPVSVDFLVTCCSHPMLMFPFLFSVPFPAMPHPQVLRVIPPSNSQRLVQLEQSFPLFSPPCAVQLNFEILKIFLPFLYTSA